MNNNTIEVKSNDGPFDAQARKEALQWIQDNFTTSELKKAVEVLKNPLKRAMLKSI